MPVHHSTVPPDGRSFPPNPRSKHISDSCFKANWFRYYRLDKDQSIRKQEPWDTKILMEFDLSLPVDLS